jgi:hypothetical protein
MSMGRPTRWRGDQLAAYYKNQHRQGYAKAGRSYLVNTRIIEFVTVGDVLPANGVVHIGLDAAGSNRIDRDFLVTKIFIMSVCNSL